MQTIDIFEDDRLEGSDSQATVPCTGAERCSPCLASEDDPFTVDFRRIAEENGSTQQAASQSSSELEFVPPRRHLPMSIVEQSPDISGKLKLYGTESRKKHAHPSTPLIKKRGAIKRTNLLSPLKRIPTAVYIDVDPPRQNELENKDDDGDTAQPAKKFSVFKKKLRINEQKSVLYFRPRKVFNLRSTRSYPDKRVKKENQSVFTDKVYLGIYAIEKNDCTDGDADVGKHDRLELNKEHSKTIKITAKESEPIVSDTDLLNSRYFFINI